jgi:hypothetical protein
MERLYTEGTKVIIHSIGKDNPKELKALIRGISSFYPGGAVYIVELVDKIEWGEGYQYSMITIPSCCVRKDSE